MNGRPHESGLRQAVCEMGRALHGGGLIAGLAGNLSVALDDERVLITPTGLRKDRLQPDDLVTLDLARPAAAQLERASSEWRMHRSCYRAHDRVGAVLHAHAPGLTAAGLRGLDLAGELPEFAETVGRSSIAAYAHRGTEELAQGVGDAVAAGATVVMLARHGVTVVGASLDDAFNRLEAAELAARAVLMARG